MSRYPPALHAHVPHQKRDSHINLGLISQGFTSQASKYNRHQTGAIEPIEESTVSRENSTQLAGLSRRDGYDSVEKQHTPVKESDTAEEAQAFTKTKHESPWNTYEEGYDLKLYEFVTVAVRKAPERGKVAIRQFVGQDVDRKIHCLKKISHIRFITLMEIFEYQKTCYVVFEHVVMSLTQVVNSPPYPTEGQLSAIVGQVS